MDHHARYVQKLREAAEEAANASETYRQEVESERAALVAERQELEEERARLLGEVEKKREEMVREAEGKIEAERTELERERREMERERERWEREKESMVDVKAKQSDIIELNVGGKPFTTTRATLCAQPDTLLASMFSGRWDQSLQHDKNGAVFLDFNPALFALLLDHLRTLQLAPPSDTHTHTLPPSDGVPSDQQKVWMAMLRYLGFFNAHTHALSKFSDAHIDKNLYDMHNDGSAVCVTGGGFNLAIVAGTAVRGFVYTWRLELQLPVLGGGADGEGLFIGVMDAADVSKLQLPNENTSVTLSSVMVAVDDGTCWIHRVEHESMRHAELSDVIRLGGGGVVDGDILDLVLDTRDTNAPFFRIPQLSTDKIPLPKEWGGYRVVLEAHESGQGVEILSVTVE